MLSTTNITSASRSSSKSRRRRRRRSSSSSSCCYCCRRRSNTFSGNSSNAKKCYLILPLSQRPLLVAVLDATVSEAFQHCFSASLTPALPACWRTMMMFVATELVNFRSCCRMRLIIKIGTYIYIYEPDTFRVYLTTFVYVQF